MADTTFPVLPIDEESRIEFEREYIRFLAEREKEKRARNAMLQTVNLASFYLD